MMNPLHHCPLYFGVYTVRQITQLLQIKPRSVESHILMFKYKSHAISEHRKDVYLTVLYPTFPLHCVPSVNALTVLHRCQPQTSEKGKHF